MTTPTRNFRIDDDLWRDAMAAAAQNGDVLAEVVRTGLQTYVADTAQQAPRVAKLAAQLQQQYPGTPLVELVRIIRAGLDTLPAADDRAVLAYAGGWLAGRQP